MRATLALVGAVALVLVAAAQGAKRNILFIPVDDMRPSIGVFGHPHVKTPNMDKLASEGTVFTNAYVQFSYCAPSRNSFMTGRNPMRTKCFNFLQHFRETDGQNWTSLPGHFKNNGFLTLGAGKTFHPGLPPNYDGDKSWSDLKQWPYINQYTKWDQCDPSTYKFGLDTAWCSNPSDNGEVFGDEITVNNTLKHLQFAAAQEQPFFIAAGFHRPHMPWAVPSSIFDEFYPDHSDLPPAPQHPGQPEGRPPLAWHPCWDNPAVNTKFNISLPTETVRSLRFGYHAAITFTDRSIGMLLAELDRLGLTNSTAVIVFGDHGWSLGEGNECKMTNTELGTRTPLIMRVPWMPAARGKVSHALVEAVDFLPTLAELAGIAASPNDTTPIDGVSQAPVFANPAAAVRNFSFSQFPRCYRGDQGVGQPTGRCAANDMRRRRALPEGTVFNVDEVFDREAAEEPENYAVLSIDERYHLALNAADDPLHNLYDMCDCHWVPSDKIDFMGFAVRTPDWRFIEWYVWNGQTLQGEFDKIVGTELYPQTGNYGSEADFDDFGNVNVATDPAHASVVSELRNVVQTYYKKFRQ